MSHPCAYEGKVVLFGYIRLNQTPLFELVCGEIKEQNHKNTCLKEIGLRLQI